MIITSYLREKPKEKPKFTIISQAGQTIYEFKLATKKGLQRITWNLQFVPKTKEGEPIKPGGAGFIALPTAPAGKYKVVLSVGDKSFEKEAVVKADPRFQFKEEERKAQLKALTEVLTLSKKMGLSVTATKNIRRQLDKLTKDLKSKSQENQDILKAVEDFDQKFGLLEGKIVPKEIGYRGSREIALRGGPLPQQLMFLGSSLSSYPSAPTQTELAQLEELRGVVYQLVTELNNYIETEIPKLNTLLKENNLKPLRVPKKVEF